MIVIWYIIWFNRGNSDSKTNMYEHEHGHELYELCLWDWWFLHMAWYITHAYY